MTDLQPTSAALVTPSPTALRRMLQDMVIADLLGPRDGEDEELEKDRPLDRYIVGALAPKGRSAASDPEEDALEDAQLNESELPSGDGEGDDDGGYIEPEPTPRRSLIPSSIGFSFCLDADTKAFRITARWGHYEKGASEHLVTPETGEPKTVWQRTQREVTSRAIRLIEGDLTDWECLEEQPGVVVKGKMRRVRGEWVVTLFLVNEQSDRRGEVSLKDAAWLFQPELSVVADDESAAFVHRRPFHSMERMSPESRRELEDFNLLYRGHCEFAVGHGVGVHAELSQEDRRRAVRITTKVMPEYEVPMTAHREPGADPSLAGLVLDMQQLAEAADGATIAAMLRPLPSAYRAWLTRQRARIGNPQEDLSAHEAAMERAFAECETAATRIEAGIALLESDPAAAESFRLANRAMWRQRVQTLWGKARKSESTAKLEQFDIPPNRSWRLFQLAFLLLNLPGITQLDHPERSADPSAVADLLWFPTGGGKTEAYLGLTAYTIFLRRLQGPIEGRTGNHGVAVLMRYTLRLLTLQQFQRAAALICACEVIRREETSSGNPRLGDEVIRLGLWVGAKSTPNNTADSAEEVKNLINKGRSRNSTPAQLTSCPWCGTSIDPGQHLRVEEFPDGAGRTYIYCGDKLGNCAFSKAKSKDGLPVLVVDEEIYRRLPALLIATVDKFARLPWVGETAMLFGEVDGYCPRHGFTSPEINDTPSHIKSSKFGYGPTKCEPHNRLRPPDLIIQDELHLISGPLGTMVGLYETAVDELCTWRVNGQRVRPKVIASTATIRRAPQQIKALFLREVAVFPPQGVDLADNFFAHQQTPDEQHPGRLYIAVCARGRRLKAALIRVYAAYLSGAQALFDKYGGAADPWMTSVGYFNAIRELAGMRRLVEDDVRTRVEHGDQRGLARRFIKEPKELTSRITAGDIPGILDQLEIRHHPKPPKGEKGPAPTGAPAIDVLLATNMISVGVDVSRLGLMIVAGQPKQAAEYIQATSRVGRDSKAPGIVCTVLNWARPRDLSHYESFEHFHSCFYRHVEPLSVTPFAGRARDRAMGALLVSLVRHRTLKYNANTGARQVDAQDQIVRHAVKQITDRATGINGDPGTGAEVLQELDSRVAFWTQSALRVALTYKESPGNSVGLLEMATGGKWGPFTCLNSLRDVESSVSLVMHPIDLCANAEERRPPSEAGGAR